MAHEITNSDWMFSGNRQVPWHGIGTVVEGLLTSADAMAAAKLNWTVGKVALKTADGMDVPRFVATRRSDNHEILGVVGEDWQCVQNQTAFNFFDSVVETREAIYETAGSLKGGRRVWLLAKLPEPLVLRKGKVEDVTEKYLLLSNGHDGGASLRMFFTPIRVVCNNTLTAALGSQGADGIRLSHTINVMHRVDEAQRTLGRAIKWYGQLEQRAKVLTDKQLTHAEMSWYFNAVFPEPKSAETTKGSKAATTRHGALMENLTMLMDSDTAKPFQGTAWAAVNAVVEYLDWGKPFRVGKDADAVAEQRLTRAFFDTTQKQTAWSVAFDLATNKVNVG